MHRRLAPRVTFQPSGRSGRARPGEPLLDLALRLGVKIRHVCGGQASCTTCRVQLLQGRLSAVGEREARRLPDRRLAEGWRLACQARPLEDAIVRVPTLIEQIRDAERWDDVQAQESPG